MNRLRYLSIRLLWSVVAVAVVVSATFLVVSLVPEFGELPLGFSAEAPEALEEAREEQANRPPVHVRYAEWMVAVFTFQWGRSSALGLPVVEIVRNRVPVTLAYLVPAVALGTVGSTLLGYLAAASNRNWPDRSVSGVTYVALSVPNFLIAGIFVRYVNRNVPDWIATQYDADLGALAAGNRPWIAVAALLLGVHLLAVQFRYVRSRSADALSKRFTDVVRAKGVGRIATARHVLRAIGVSLLSVFVTSTLGLLFVSVFVIEAVLGIPGIGAAAYEAARNADRALLLVLTMLVAATIVLGNLCQDVANALLDPRFDQE